MKPILLALVWVAAVLWADPCSAARRSGHQSMLLAQGAVEIGPQRPPNSIEELHQWRAKLERLKADLEKESAALAEQRAVLEAKQKSLKPGAKSRFLEAEIRELNQKIKDYDQRRIAFQQQVDAYTKAQADLQARGIRETVQYRGPVEPVVQAPAAETQPSETAPAAGGAAAPAAPSN